MLRSVRLLKKHTCLEEGLSLAFRPGLNLLVGDQGVGKSTLLRLLRDNNTEVLSIEADPIRSMSFDFEKDNPRLSPGIYNKVQVAMLFSSHGQTNMAILKSLGDEKGKLFLMDEPDMALSIRSCVKLVRLFETAVERGNQVVAAVHNPIIIESVSEVLSLEHRTWMGSSEFIQLMRTT